MPVVPEFYAIRSRSDRRQTDLEVTEMSSENHEWMPGADPPGIRPHSVAKHRVIDAYLRRYVEVLTSDVRIPEFYLTLVDGFSGGGVYCDATSGVRRPGSPLIMLEAMKDAADTAQEKRSKEFNLAVEYFFIEKLPNAFEYLGDTLRQSDFADMIDDRVTLLNGEFTANLPAIVDRIESRGRGRRAIFLLDQCGYKDVPLPEIRNILSRLDNAEIILTFATDSLIDYLSTNETTQRILERVGLEISSEEVMTLKALRDWRRAIQLLLHDEIHRKSGARYYTPFFIRSKDAHRDFWLIHLSGAARARDVMVAEHWRQNTSFAHYGRSGLQMLGYDPDEDFTLTKQQALPGFYFDDSARASSHECLLEQLPERLFDSKDGIQFDQFFAAITNETPVTSEIIKDVLEDLAREGIVKVQGQKGEKRQGRIQRGSDIIIPSKQKRLFMPGDDL